MDTINSMCLKLWRGCELLSANCFGQDLIEYALMAGLVAVAVVGMSPGVTSSFTIIWSRVNSVVLLSAST
jgi:Flp pilus assembly pilin Flp